MNDENKKRKAIVRVMSTLLGVCFVGYGDTVEEADAEACRQMEEAHRKAGFDTAKRKPENQKALIDACVQRFIEHKKFQEEMKKLEELAKREE